VDTKRGIAASPGVAVGPVFVFESEGARIPRKYLMPDEVHHEIERFDNALAASRREITELGEKLRRKLGDGPKASDILQIHRDMLEDPKLREQVVALVTNRLFTPEYAVTQILRRYGKPLEDAGDSYLLQRARDFEDIEQRLLRHLLGRQLEDLGRLQQPVVIVARDLAPSQTAGLDKEKVLGIATETGGRTSHTAILARALGIPAVVGVQGLCGHVVGGDLMIVDGAHGVVILNPDALARHRYEALGQTRTAIEERIAAEFCNLPAVTTDGRRIGIEANIEFTAEVPGIFPHGAEGVGLYRTEFLYHTASQPPDEEAHFRAYMEAIQSLQGRPMTIRVLDLGADKFPAGFAERNPLLGCRSMRMLRLYPEIFRHQIRAILRASAMGKIRFMFPMIANLSELRDARRVVQEVREELDRSALAYDRQIKIGMMIEVPSAAVMADAFAQEVDFFSIGTNDLVQYSLAVDRGNEHVSHLYSAVDPAVLRMMRQTLNAADAAGIECSICGEMAGDILNTILLVGMGFRKLSMTPNAIPDVKKLIRSISFAEAQRVAEQALALKCAGEIETLLAKETRRVIPELLDADEATA
jgi:phosphotransferase system enzyme I (PtsI)